MIDQEILFIIYLISKELILEYMNYFYKLIKIANYRKVYKRYFKIYLYKEKEIISVKFINEQRNKEKMYNIIIYFLFIRINFKKC